MIISTKKWWLGCHTNTQAFKPSKPSKPNNDIMPLQFSSFNNDTPINHITRQDNLPKERVDYDYDTSFCEENMNICMLEHTKVYVPKCYTTIIAVDGVNDMEYSNGTWFSTELGVTGGPFDSDNEEDDYIPERYQKRLSRWLQKYTFQDDEGHIIYKPTD